MANNIGIIIGREFNERVRKKSFIITTLLMPILMIALMAAPALIMSFSQGEEKRIAVIDESGLVLPELENDETLSFEPTDRTVEEARKAEGEYFAVLHIGSDVLKTNSVCASMIVHFVSNALTLILSYAGFAFALPIWASVLVAVAGFAIMWALSLLLKNTEKPRTQEEVLEIIEKPAPKVDNNPAPLKIGIYLAILLFAFSAVLGFMPPIE